MGDEARKEAGMNAKEKTISTLQVAKMYYQRDMSQGEIAKTLSLSRPTVSRLLQYARETGLVHIEIAEPMAGADELADQLRSQYRLNDAIVVATRQLAPQNRLDAVGQTAADYIEANVHDDDTIGIGWGKTLYGIGTHLTPQDVHGVSVVQIKGSVSNTESNNFSFESANAFANAFHTLPQYLPLPVIFQNPETKELIEQETYIRHIFDMGRRARIVVFTVGTVRDSALLFHLGYLSDEEQIRLQHSAVGDVLSRFIDKDGNLADEDINQRTVGMELEELKAKPCSILTVGTPKKVPATHGALIAGYANTLIIDDISAADLLSYGRSRQNQGLDPVLLRIPTTPKAPSVSNTSS